MGLNQIIEKEEGVIPLVGIVIFEKDQIALKNDEHHEKTYTEFFNVPVFVFDEKESLIAQIDQTMRKVVGIPLKEVESYIDHFQFFSEGQKYRQYNFLVKGIDPKEKMEDFSEITWVHYRDGLTHPIRKELSHTLDVCGEKIKQLNEKRI